MRNSTIVLVLVSLCFISTIRAQRVADDVESSVDVASFDNGIATVAGISGIGSFAFGGSNLIITGVLRDGSVAAVSCSPCSVGSTISLRSAFGGPINSSLSTGSVQFLSYAYNVYFGGDLVFDGGMLTIPTQNSRRPIIIRVPATVTGNVAGYFRNPFIGDPGPALFVNSVSLQGTATVVLRPDSFYPVGGVRLYTFQSITYDFPAIEPLASQ